MSCQLERLCRPRLDHSLARAIVLFGLESSDAVETDSLGKTFDAAELVDGAVGIDREHTNFADAGQYVEQVLSISANSHVEIGRALRKGANDSVGNGTQRASRANRESCHRGCSRVIDKYPFCVGSNGIPAVAVAKGWNALGDCSERAVGVDRIRGDRGCVSSAVWLILGNDELTARSKCSCEYSCSDALVRDNSAERATRKDREHIDAVRSLLYHDQPLAVRAH